MRNLLLICLLMNSANSRPYSPNFEGKPQAFAWVCETVGDCGGCDAIDISKPLNFNDNLEEIDWYFIRTCESDLRMFDKETSDKLTKFSSYAVNGLKFLEEANSVDLCWSLACKEFPLADNLGLNEINKYARLYLLLILRTGTYQTEYEIGDLIEFYLCIEKSRINYVLVTGLPNSIKLVVEAVEVLDEQGRLTNRDKLIISEYIRFYSDARIRKKLEQEVNIAEAGALCLAELVGTKNIFGKVVFDKKKVKEIYELLNGKNDSKLAKKEIESLMRGESPILFVRKTIEYFNLVHAILGKDISIDECLNELKQIEFSQIEPDSIWSLANPSYNLRCIIDLIQENRVSINILNHEQMPVKTK